MLSWKRAFFKVRFKHAQVNEQNWLPIKIVIYDVSVKSEILFCKWGRLGN
jgi:hypothetical protein